MNALERVTLLIRYALKCTNKIRSGHFFETREMVTPNIPKNHHPRLQLSLGLLSFKLNMCPTMYDIDQMMPMAMIKLKISPVLLWQTGLRENYVFSKMPLFLQKRSLVLNTMLILKDNRKSHGCGNCERRVDYALTSVKPLESTCSVKKMRKCCSQKAGVVVIIYPKYLTVY